ncbi:TPA: DUF5320 domain-containing protein [bacterium]|jgi:hypothetical protein|nr:DUF5320 domain-containing protein [bacterium]
MFNRKKDVVNPDTTIGKKVREYQKDNPYEYGVGYFDEVKKHAQSYNVEAASEPEAVENQKKVLENYKNELKRDIAEIDAQLKNLR